MEYKKITAIICEYNPFHMGHAYQIKEAKKFSDIIICIMSGNTVQRGGFSIFDKYERAKIAIENGADIVVEHPFPYCSSSAADFADSGIYIANSMKATILAFGHESEEKFLLEIADLLSNSNFSKQLNDIYKKHKNMKKYSFPKLREQYLNEIYGDEKSSLLKLPNNILAVEYLLSLKKYTNIAPWFIKRNFDFISAGNIREKIFNHEDVSEHVPCLVQKIFDQTKHDKAILTSLILSEDYKDFYDCDSSLYNRIISYAQKAKSLDELIMGCTTSAYTSSKVRRAIFSILFNVKKDDVKSLPKFTVLLGASKKGIQYISQNKKNFEIPILTRTTDEKNSSVNTDLNFKPGKIYSLLNDEKYTPYKKPYIMN